MIDLHFYDNKDYDDWYFNDIRRISDILNARGYAASYDDIKRAWEAHSEDYAAGWLVLPNDDTELFNDIMKYLKT